jgi:hypothetical protein
MAAEYYTVETVRDQILQSGRIDKAPDNFPPDWKFCPCLLSSRCPQLCTISLTVFFTNPRISLSVIEIIYIKEKQRGFIRVGHMQLNRLIEKGIINKENLEIISF